MLLFVNPAPIGGGSGPSESREGVAEIEAVEVDRDAADEEDGALGLIKAAIENRLEPRPGLVFPLVFPSTSTPSRMVPGLGDFLLKLYSIIFHVPKQKHIA